MGEFTAEALAEEAEESVEQVSQRVIEAIRHYLADRGSARPGWRFPDFLPSASGAPAVALELSVEEGLWSSLEQEAVRQGVSAQRLAEHAALYFAAERDVQRPRPPSTLRSSVSATSSCLRLLSA